MWRVFRRLWLLLWVVDCGDKVIDNAITMFYTYYIDDNSGARQKFRSGLQDSLWGVLFVMMSLCYHYNRWI